MIKNLRFVEKRYVGGYGCNDTTCDNQPLFIYQCSYQIRGGFGKRELPPNGTLIWPLIRW